MIHGQEREEQRRRDYQRSELTSLAERLLTVEAMLNDASRRLALMERQLTGGDVPVQSGTNDHTGR